MIRSFLGFDPLCVVSHTLVRASEREEEESTVRHRNESGRSVGRSVGRLIRLVHRLPSRESERGREGSGRRDLREPLSHKPHGTYLRVHVSVAPDVASRNLYAGHGPPDPYPQHRPRSIDLSPFCTLSPAASLSHFLPVFLPSFVLPTSRHVPQSLPARGDIGTAYRVSIAATIIAGLCATSRRSRLRRRRNRLDPRATRFNPGASYFVAVVGPFLDYFLTKNRIVEKIRAVTINLAGLGEPGYAFNRVSARRDITRRQF